MKLKILYFDIVEYASLLCVFMGFFVMFLLVGLCLYVKGVYSSSSENSFLEFFWTVIPTISVAFSCYYKVCYVTSSVEPVIENTMKVMGRQWYWSYEYTLFNNKFDYDSYMLQLVNNVDKPVIMEYGVPVRLLMSSSDVMHSFSVPDLGIKADAMPGRMNQMAFVPDRLGSFVGYCSELCGSGHSYMPIVMEVMNSS